MRWTSASFSILFVFVRLTMWACGCFNCLSFLSFLLNMPTENHKQSKYVYYIFFVCRTNWLKWLQMRFRCFDHHIRIYIKSKILRRRHKNIAPGVFAYDLNALVSHWTFSILFRKVQIQSHFRETLSLVLNHFVFSYETRRITTCFGSFMLEEISRLKTINRLSTVDVSFVAVVRANVNVLAHIECV